MNIHIMEITVTGDFFMDKELDELIRRYTDDLIKLKEKWSQLGITTEKEAVLSPPEETVELISEHPSEAEAATVYDTTHHNPAVTPDEDENQSVPYSEETPSANPENFAFFSANVFTGNQAYPVANAKISVYLDDKLYAFLITDENGKTKKIRLESYPKSNSFIPENTQQSVDYSADIAADGFYEAKNLLVSAVGGSDILLNTELTPLSERID